jgi:glycerol uptake facilitator-like aquaporin
MNPAISLAMWRFGVFPGAGVMPYTIAQLLGSVLGVLAARVVWGQVVAEPPVVYAVLQPGPLWSTADLFTAESLSISGQTQFLWSYLLAPMLGALIAAWLRQTIQRRRAVLTHRLCGTQADGRRLSDPPTPNQTHYLVQGKHS